MRSHPVWLVYGDSHAQEGWWAGDRFGFRSATVGDAKHIARCAGCTPLTGRAYRSAIHGRTVFVVPVRRETRCMHTS